LSLILSLTGLLATVVLLAIGIGWEMKKGKKSGGQEVEKS